MRQMVWAFDKVKKTDTANLRQKISVAIKHSKRLLIKRNTKLKDFEKERSNSLLYIPDEMLQAYYLKEQFYKIMDANDRQTAKRLMSDWISSAESSNIEEYMYCAKTLLNWQTGILNSFDVPYSNGFTEGCNNKIKVLKRNAYGYRNFERFRNRILHMFSYKNDLAKQGRRYTFIYW